MERMILNTIISEVSHSGFYYGAQLNLLSHSSIHVQIRETTLRI